MSFLESVFEFLFKYRAVLFERGDFTFAAAWPLALPVLAGAAVAVPSVLTYARAGAAGSGGRVRGRDRAVLGVLRGAAVAVLLFCLFRPTLLVSAAVPQQNFLGILVDDSRSMQIADVDGRARAEFVRRALGGPDSSLARALSERFLLRFYRFAGGADRVAAPAELGFAGTQTSLAAALDRARQDLAAVPLSGLVVVTDGADNAAGAARATGAAGAGGAAGSALTEQILSLRARGIPVYTIGVGRPAFERDVEIGRVEAPRTVLEGSSVAVDVLVRQTGYGGTTVPLVVEDGGRIVATQDVKLTDGAEAAPVRVHVTLAEAGPRLLKFRVPPREGEMVAENNEQEALVVVQDRREKILYIEGEPRFELKFVRRAVAEDENLQVVALQRTAEGKFLRLGVDDSLELVAGFPRTREELFAYRAVILGSIEASFFTHDQLRMLADFVGERGGGLLMLGGRSAFAEGGYADTPLGDVLPVALGRGRDTTYLAELDVEATPAGVTHSATQVAKGEQASAERWRALPPVTTVNRLGEVKPGATVLLTGTPVAGGDRQPVLAFQRYGRGKAVALGIQDSWMWQMHADVPVEDMTHETFWRQLVRWLVSGVPGRVSATPSSDHAAPGQSVALTALVADERFVEVNNASVTAKVTSPAGVATTVPLEWGVDRDGEYRAAFTPEEDGTYRVAIEARKGDQVIGADTAFVRRAAPRAEYFDAQMHESLLRRIAEETGGRFYTPASAGALPNDVRYTNAGTTVVERKDLWDMPVNYLLLAALLAAEWAYRRKRGLA